jgi:aminoglycoside phosphotransferase (APT) family kinase protein
MTAPPAQGVRLPYDETPTRLRAWVDDSLGSPVVAALTQPGGFSPGVAARLRCADGTRAFCKAVSPAANADSPQVHRAEASTAAALPAAAPVPRLIASYDDEVWVALLFEDVGGRQPRLPWGLEELTRVATAIDGMHAVLTPCPTNAPVVSEGWHEQFTNWRLVESAPTGLDEWCVRHLAALEDMESRWEQAATGDTLLHMDLRADNLVVTDQRVWIVDWPWATRGHPLLDLVAFAPSVAMQGGPEPSATLALSRTGRTAERDRLLPLVCAVAGYFVCRSVLPAPPGLPTVRAFQAAQAEVALRWLQALTRWR